MYADNVLSNAVRQMATGQNKSMQSVLDSTITGIRRKIISIPDGVSVLRLYSDQIIRVALSEIPDLISTATFGIGSICNASEWTTFVLANGLTRTLQIVTAATMGNVMIELY